MSTVVLEWWPEKPVLEVKIEGGIADRDEALKHVKAMVDQLESSAHHEVIVIIDLTKLGGSPSSAALLAGSLPQTEKIAHLVFVRTPALLRMAALPLVHLRGRLHFMDNPTAARAKIDELLPKLRRRM